MANEAEQSLSSPVPALLQGSYTFKEDEVLPWRHIDNLGRGGFGSVDRVEQIHGGQILARKVLRYQPRQAKQVKAKFEEEIAHLQKLGSHRHVVQLICTYQHECDFGILMLPVAPINLYDFLRKRMSSNEEDRYLETLLQSFGCLLSGLSFIHSQGIRHKDIKPQNVLVDPQSSSKFLFTDFGLSRDFSDLSKSYTSGRPDAFSSRYCAPEVAAYTKRGRKADIFSLGCVFVEIAAVLRRTTPDGLEDYVLAKAGDENADSMSFSVHHEVVVEWIRLERQRLLLAEAMRPIFDLCECMITENPSDRPHLETLFKILMSCATPEASCLYFCESCFLKHVPSSLELTIPTPQAAREFFRLRLEKYLMDFIEHRASGEEDPHYAGEMIILWIQALDHLDPAGLSTIVKIILEAVLRECSSHPEDDTRPKAMITKCTNLCGQINTGLAPRRRGIFQSGVTLFCHEEVERVIRLDNLAEEMSDAIRYRSTQRTLCFAEILKRLYTMDLVSADPINKYIQHLLPAMIKLPQPTVRSSITITRMVYLAWNRAPQPLFKPWPEDPESQLEPKNRTQERVIGILISNCSIHVTRAAYIWIESKTKGIMMKEVMKSTLRDILRDLGSLSIFLRVISPPYLQRVKGFRNFRVGVGRINPLAHETHCFPGSGVVRHFVKNCQL